MVSTLRQPSSQNHATTARKNAPLQIPHMRVKHLSKLLELSQAGPHYLIRWPAYVRWSMVSLCVALIQLWCNHDTKGQVNLTQCIEVVPSDKTILNKETTLTSPMNSMLRQQRLVEKSLPTTQK